jgi:hypothetical protein
MTQCTAKSKRSGQRCRDQAMKGKDKCYHHGGATPRGAASANFKHGRYSKSLPAALAGKYEEFLAHPDLRGLGHELALLDTRVADVLRGLEGQEAPTALWQGLLAAYDELKLAQASRDARAGALAVAKMGLLITEGARQGAIWDEVFGLVDERRKLVDVETRRQLAAQQIVTADEMLMLVGALVAMVREAVLAYVSDAKIARAILSRIQSTVDRQLLAGSLAANSADDTAVAGAVLELGAEEVLQPASRG